MNNAITTHIKSFAKKHLPALTLNLLKGILERSKIFLFFLSLSFTSANAEHATIVHSWHQKNTKHYNHPSHTDFSHDTSRNSISTSPSYAHHFKHYNEQDFKQHFNEHGYTESQILDQHCLYMSDEFVKCAQTYAGYKDAIQQLHTELKSLCRWQKWYRYAFTRTYCRGLQKRIHYLYSQLHTLKQEIPSHNEPILRDRSLETFHTQLPEYRELKTTYQEYAPSLSCAIDKRLDAYKQTCGDYALQYASKPYNLNNDVKQLLHKYNYDTTRFTQCSGNQLQHAIHQESLDLLDRIDNLSPTSVLYDHQEALVDFTVAMVDYNRAGLTDKATTIADFCWTLLDYGQAVAEGAALGIQSAVTDILNNPIEATLSIVASKPLLAYQLSKVLYNVADIGFTAITNLNEAKDKWNKYSEPLNSIIDKIYNKEISLRDAVKGGTALVVGVTAQGNLLSGLGKFCNTIKQKTVTFAQNSSLFNPQQYLTTPEGLLFKATANANKLKQSGNATASGLKSNIDTKVFKNKSIKRLIKQEGLPTQGKLRYVPPKKLSSFDKLPHKKLPGKRIGFIDRFDNLWVKGPSRTQGQPFEWDVQLSKQGIQQVGWMTRDNSHLNVSLDGRVTHK